jgi:hypothetical protein
MSSEKDMDGTYTKLTPREICPPNFQIKQGNGGLAPDSGILVGQTDHLLQQEIESAQTLPRGACNASMHSLAG